MTHADPPGPLPPEPATRIHALFDQLEAEHRGPAPACRCGQPIGDGDDPLECGHQDA